MGLACLFNSVWLETINYSNKKKMFSFRSGEGFLVVFSLSEPDTLEETKAFIDQIERVKVQKTLLLLWSL